jgi:dihydroorotate dehydrogenase (NAD+) catalytic subunit
MTDGILDLAPHNPYGLAIGAPLLPAPGCAVRDADLSRYGAVVSRTATLHTRHDPVPRFAPHAGGLVVSALPTVGLRTLLKEETKRWERLTQPVIVSLRGDRDELGEMTARLENYDIAGVLLEAEGDAVDALKVVRAETPRPILFLLQFEQASLATAQALASAGADALVVATPPRAAAPTGDGWDGFLIGPAVFPLVLQALRDLQDLDVPLVALGGIASPDAARAALAAGASAVMLDAARWGNLVAPTLIADALDHVS